MIWLCFKFGVKFNSSSPLLHYACWEAGNKHKMLYNRALKIYETNILYLCSKQ